MNEVILYCYRNFNNFITILEIWREDGEKRGRSLDLDVKMNAKIFTWFASISDSLIHKSYQLSYEIAGIAVTLMS